MKLQKYISKILDVFAALCLIMFFISFNFQDNLVNGWYQQYLPAGINNNINSIVFTDSLTGYIATASDNNGNGYLLKTTNGGDNWFIFKQNLNSGGFQCLQFLNKDSAIVQDANYIYKTKNAGINWDSITYPMGIYTFALNYDTLFEANSSSIIGGLWRTTNGGTSWTQLVNFGSCNPEKIYFFNKNIGFIVRCSDTYKTTDGGYNWSYIPSGGFTDIYFFDSLTGFLVSNFYMKKTTDGGLNWVTQQMPNIFEPAMINFFTVNRDTIWGGGGYIWNGNNNYSGVIYKTINGGLNWGYQVPLNNYTIVSYSFIDFIEKIKGWSYKYQNTGVHTKIGGSDTTIFTGVNSNITSTPEDFVLIQNYPNPFNAISKIKYQISKSVNIKIKIFDISGKEIITLVNEQQNRGNYEIKFNGNNLSSGIYFYSLYADEVKVDTKKMMLIK